MLHAAVSIADLKVPLGNKLEKLRVGGRNITAFASIISGESVSSGMTAMHTMLKSKIITKHMPTKIKPIHPGEILNEEFLKSLAITEYRLAKSINVPARRINEIVHGNRAISADTALRFAAYFGTSAEFWTNLQSRHDLLIEHASSGKRIEKEIRRFDFIAV